MIEVRTPCRLHFGLLALADAEGRQFGGVGLMVRQPEVVIRVRQADAGADACSAAGELADRAAMFASRVVERAVERGLIDQPTPVHVDVVATPGSHVGMGSGTQLGMAVARGVMALLTGDATTLTARELAWLAGRGERSAIGAYGFQLGGLIVEGGKRQADRLSPLLARHAFPEDWRVLLIQPSNLLGPAGSRERQLIADLGAIPQKTTAEMCRLVLLGLLPGVVERDIDAFGDALYDLQQTVGRCFAPAQGGVYAHPLLEQIVDHVRSQGVRGVGQTSWGPTLYAVVASQSEAESLRQSVAAAFALPDDALAITAADNTGSMVRRV